MEHKTEVGAPLGGSAPSPVVTLTGFKAGGKRKVRSLVTTLGVCYQGDLICGVTTHLICRRLLDAFGTPKYIKALEWGIHIVSPAWLFDSLKAGVVLPPENYKTDSAEALEALHALLTASPSRTPLSCSTNQPKIAAKAPNKASSASLTVSAKAHSTPRQRDALAGQALDVSFKSPHVNHVSLLPSQPASIKEPTAVQGSGLTEGGVRCSVLAPVFVESSFAFSKEIAPAKDDTPKLGSPSACVHGQNAVQSPELLVPSFCGSHRQIRSCVNQKTHTDSCFIPGISAARKSKLMEDIIPGTQFEEFDAEGRTPESLVQYLRANLPSATKTNGRVDDEFAGNAGDETAKQRQGLGLTARITDSPFDGDGETASGFNVATPNQDQTGRLDPANPQSEPILISSDSGGFNIDTACTDNSYTDHTCSPLGSILSSPDAHCFKDNMLGRGGEQNIECESESDQRQQSEPELTQASAASTQRCASPTVVSLLTSTTPSIASVPFVTRRRRNVYEQVQVKSEALGSNHETSMVKTETTCEVPAYLEENESGYVKLEPAVGEPPSSAVRVRTIGSAIRAKLQPTTVKTEKPRRPAPLPRLSVCTTTTSADYDDDDDDDFVPTTSKRNFAKTDDITSHLNRVGQTLRGHLGDGEVVVLKSLTRAPRSSTARDYHDVSSSKLLEYAEQVQLSWLDLVLCTKQQSVRLNCLILALSVNNRIQVTAALPFAFYKLQNGDWWMEYYRLYTSRDIQYLAQLRTASIVLPPDFVHTHELLRDTDRDHCKLRDIRGEVKVLKSKKIPSCKKDTFFSRYVFDSQLMQVLTEQPASEFVCT